MIAIPHYISAQEYLEIEKQSQIRHEYRRGLVYAMAGGTDNHDRLALNLLNLINSKLGDSEDCRFHSGNVKVNYKDDYYYYPDAFVTCDLRDRQNRYIKKYPKLVVEVLSSSTQAFDEGDKFSDYQQIETLEEYVLISQTSQRIDCYRKIDADNWQRTTYRSGDEATLKSIDLTFSISEIYRGLDGKISS